MKVRKFSLKRPLPKQAPRKKFYIFSEGKNTEPDYFNMVKSTRLDALVALVIRDGAGDPKKIAEYAVEKKKEILRSKDSFTKSDEVWAVFDRDEHEHWGSARSSCTQNSVGLACSNPCFELWLILHFIDYDAPDDRHQIQRQATSIVPGYDHSHRKLADCTKLIDLVESAEKRAEIQNQRRIEERLEFGPPSTSVWRLTKAIREWNKFDK